MDEFEELYGSEFFIIDSNDLESVETKLYGYLIDRDKFYTTKNMNYNAQLSGLGAYVFVNNTFDEITIKQDANGSYGIFVYKYEDQFCISNSFLKLLEYVKHRYPISFNENAAGALLAYNYSSYIYKQTLVNEIENLPRNHIVKIDKITKKIMYETIDFEEKTIPLDSKEAFDIIDDWFFRWTGLFRNLKKETNNITADLTGGFDSRITFALLLASNIDLNQIHIRSIKDEVYTHKEDYQIASQIAKEFGFELNNMTSFDLNRYYFEDLETSMKLCAYLKFGIHNQFFYRYFKNVTPCYSITGYGGENIRHYTHMIPLDEFITNAEALSPELVEPTKRVIDYNINHIKNDFYGRYNDENIDFAITKETIHTYHFGRGTLEKYLTNEFSLSPLTDPQINKIKRHDGICTDKNLLITIIYSRYWPKLLDFDFNGDSEIKDETIEYAKKLNEKYPFKFEGYDLVSSDIEGNTKELPHKTIRVKDIDDLLMRIFFSNTFEKYFEVYYSPELYTNLVSRVKNMSYVPPQCSYPAFAIMKVLHDINVNKYDKNEDWISWLKHFEDTGIDYEYPNAEILRKLLIYNTARIDILNHGKNNDLNIVSCSDKNCKPNKPQWIKPETGRGIILESNANSLDFKIKCIQDGTITINLKGKDVRDRDRKRFPVYIDYTKLQVNGKTIFNESTLTWHDKPYSYNKEIKDGEEITVHVEWKPFDHQSVYK